MTRCLLAALLLAPAAHADDTAAFLKAENWQGLSEYWVLDAEKKTLTGRTEKDPKFNTFFCSKAEYADFDLSFQVRLKDGKGNSGVQVRSKLVDKEKFIVAGPQADIGDRYWGSLYGERVGGMMYEASRMKVKEILKPDDWNDYAISVRGTRIAIKLNGEVMSDDDFPTTPNADPLAKQGIIAFQLHAGPPMTVEFREFLFVSK